MGDFQSFQVLCDNSRILLVEEEGHTQIVTFTHSPAPSPCLLTPDITPKTENIHFPGLDLNTAISDARRMRGLLTEDRKNEMQKLCTYLSESLELTAEQRVPRRVLFFRVGRGLGSYVSMLYLIVKVSQGFRFWLSVGSFLGFEAFLCKLKLFEFYRGCPKMGSEDAKFFF